MRLYQLLNLVLLPVLALISVGCSSNEEPKAPFEISEFSSAEGTSALDTPEGELFEQARSLYESGLYSIAKEQFATLRTGYPLSPFAEFAELKIADCDFEGGYYEVAAQAYEEFLKNHPASSSAPYVAYRTARSYQLASKGVGRDSGPLEKALALYDAYLVKHSESVYAESARKFRNEVISDLAAYEKRIADFYKKAGHEAASAEREKKREALAGRIKTETLSSSSSPKPQLVRVERRKAPLEVAQPALAKSEEQPIRDATYVVRDVQCQGNKFFILLNKELKDKALYDAISNSSLGRFSFTLPDTTGQTKELACGSLGTVSFQDSGKLEFDVPSKITAMSLDNPPRILVSPVVQ